MFDFTKEVVINSKNFDNTKDGKFHVHGGGNYDAQYIVEKKVYKTPAQDGKLAVLSIDAATLVGKMKSDAKHFTLNIELGLDRDARQDWATAVYLFKKPMVVDVHAGAWVESKENEELAKMLKAVLTDYKFVHVLLNGDEKDEAFAKEIGVTLDTGVNVVGADYNVKVRNISVMEYACEARCEVASEEPDAIYNGRPDDGADYGIKYTPNAVEFGTYNYLLHNLRMPTYENYRFTSPAAVEMPIAGAKYSQYTFLYCVPRPGLGGLSVAGQTNHSTTTHVFYVQEGEVADDFDAMLSAAGIVDDSDTNDVVEGVVPGVDHDGFVDGYKEIPDTTESDVENA